MNLLRRGNTILGIGYLDFKPGDGEEQIALVLDLIPENVLLNYEYDEETKTIKTRDVPLTHDDYLDIVQNDAAKKDRIINTLRVKMTERAVLVDIGDGTKEIDDRIASLKAKLPSKEKVAEVECLT